MRSRKEIHKRKPFAKRLRLLVGAIVLTVFIGGSINVAFADQDLSSILLNWFDRNQTESITEIDRAITEEQAKQTERLKKELRAEIEHAKEQLNTFTAAERKKSIDELQTYADALIENIDVNYDDEKASVMAKYQSILQDAKDQMSKIQSGGKADAEDSADAKGNRGDEKAAESDESSKQKDVSDPEAGNEK
ncbi:hypothetical protein JNUCC1_00855 [Lentibacillus sp. JNUCC-1]|nr:hypothetical protein [Lentibacillus sp. JNUCC-1]